MGMAMIMLGRLASCFFFGRIDMLVCIASTLSLSCSMAGIFFFDWSSDACGGSIL